MKITICDKCASWECPYNIDDEDDVPKIRAIEEKGECKDFMMANDDVIKHIIEEKEKVGK